MSGSETKPAGATVNVTIPPADTLLVQQLRHGEAEADHRFANLLTWLMSC